MIDAATSPREDDCNEAYQNGPDGSESMTIDFTPEQIAALDHARHLAESGVPVFVARPDPDGKTESGRQTGFMLPKDWQTTTPNPRYVDAWEPGFALCAVMGQVVDLVDVDPRNGGSLADVAEIMSCAIGMQTTPSDGIHVFVPRLGIRSRTNALPGIDIKAGADGKGVGFAFLAPTERFSKTSGELTTYGWLTPPHLNGSLDADLSGFIARIGSDKPSRADGGADEWSVPDVIEPGTRNKTLFDLACLWRGHGLSMRIARMEMEDAWHRCEQTGAEPFLLAEANAILERVYDEYKINAWPGIVPSTPVLRTGEAENSADAEAPIEDRYASLYLRRSGLIDLPRGEPLIADVLDRHTYFVVSGRDKSYKSFMVLDWLACLASGGAWLGRHEAKQVKVLYVVGEGAWGLNDRVTAWEKHHDVQLSDEWFHVRRASLNLFRQSEEFGDLLRRVEDEGYGAVVFDTLQRISAGAEANSSGDAGIIVAGLDRVRQATDNGSVGVVAHSDKLDRDTRGSSAYEDDADIVWRMKRNEDNDVVHAVLDKRKDGPDGTQIELRPHLVADTSSLVLQEITLGASMFAVSDKPPAHNLEVLKMLAGSAIGENGMSVTALADAVGLKGKSGIYNVLNWFIDHGYVRKIPGGRGTYAITDQGRAQLMRIKENPE